ncbi:cysteine desulfurase CsdA [Putridiphycobacter roseus]|uniref:Cysteine desulfurase n=1 Tax=Putridiphycobacter roseus TaxID=2219161 RepID=A0A2W1N261_9FLAO|nr:cysteine desulfurase [Putridiphycobacter roseus]PZE17041.1 cysteine desulfurase CsdA [Putridiphycobacter roseus]
MSFDVAAVRSEFPILKEKIGKYPLVYLDNGATTQKPQIVIDAICNYYTHQNANIHRGVHHLSQVSTEAYETARTTIQKAINATHNHECIFTKGTTDGINLIAHSFGKGLEKGDEIIISALEHHSNIVPWQFLVEEKGVLLKVIPMLQDGSLDFDAFLALLSAKTKLLSITHISNALGIINPIEKYIEAAHKVGAKVLIDAAQSLQHFAIDVQALDCDFMVFSGHKIFGPTGVGILYGKEVELNALPPYQGGGDMIKTVTFEKTTYNELPHKFEAGTPNIVGGIALGTAFEWRNKLDLKAVEAHENELLAITTEALLKIDGLKIYGDAPNKSSVISFLIDGLHPYDIGTLLNQQGVAVRTGHHCTQPIMDYYHIPGTIRVSFSLYNTKSDVESLITALKKAVKMLK